MDETLQVGDYAVIVNSPSLNGEIVRVRSATEDAALIFVSFLRGGNGTFLPDELRKINNPELWF
jgi:hypothetical protein